MMTFHYALIFGSLQMKRLSSKFVKMIQESSGFALKIKQLKLEMQCIPSFRGNAKNFRNLLNCWKMSVVQKGLSHVRLY